jgi:dienelactone hydrolase
MLTGSAGQAKGKGAMAPGKYSPKERTPNDNSPGTGPYPAAYFTDPSLAAHTIYAPKNPPKDMKLPAFVFGNGGCGNIGTGFQNFLREIASHGFIAIANGPPAGGAGGMMGKGQTKMTAMTQSLDWIMKGGANGKFGQIDSSKIGVGGQSCGGLEAYSASYHDDRVKTTILLNSGVIDEQKTYLLRELKAPVAMFIGGPKDIAYVNVCGNLTYSEPIGILTRSF